MIRRRSAQRITVLVLVLVGLRALTWFIEPLLPVLIVLGALFVIYKFIFRDRFF